MFEKDGFVFEDEEEYLSCVSETNERKRKRKKRAFGCLFSVLAVLCFFCYFAYLFKHSYYIFTSGRIEKMEDKFNITVTDDIKLERYDFKTGWLDIPSRYELFISDIEDYDEFMQNNVNGEIKARIQNGIRYDYEEKKSYEYQNGDNEYIICYVYEYRKQGYETDEFFNYTRYIFFYEESDGKYSARIANGFY